MPPLQANFRNALWQVGCQVETQFLLHRNFLAEGLARIAAGISRTLRRERPDRGPFLSEWADSLTEGHCPDIRITGQHVGLADSDQVRQPELIQLLDVPSAGWIGEVPLCQQRQVVAGPDHYPIPNRNSFSAAWGFIGSVPGDEKATAAPPATRLP